MNEAWDMRYDAMNDRVGGKHVYYSAYKKGPDNLPEDNLDTVAVEGRVVFIQPHDEFWGIGEDYRSAVVENPTWLDVAQLADTMIQTTGDGHHVFLEAVRSPSEYGVDDPVDTETDEQGPIKVMRFVMGS